MEATNQVYDYTASDARITSILDSAEVFEEVNEIPARSRLTFSNGFYVNCTALFIDIRRSSELPNKHTRPVLGKLYRAYLSECVAIINADPNCREVFIQGDCVSGVISTPYKPDIDSAFQTTARLNSMTQILNWRLEQKGYAQIDCGIGLAYGRALMLKAGYSGSAINDVIWMGDVVNEASNLCHQGNKLGRASVQVSTSVHSNLKDEYKKLLTPVPELFYFTHYEGAVISLAMEKWLEEEKLKANKAKSTGGLLAWLSTQ
jgi:class 3 adenylate cyclase